MNIVYLYIYIISHLYYKYYIYLYFLSILYSVLKNVNIYMGFPLGYYC